MNKFDDLMSKVMQDETPVALDVTVADISIIWVQLNIARTVVGGENAQKGIEDSMRKLEKSIIEHHPDAQTLFDAMWFFDNPDAT